VRASFHCGLARAPPADRDRKSGKEKRVSRKRRCHFDPSRQLSRHESRVDECVSAFLSEFKRPIYNDRVPFVSFKGAQRLPARSWASEDRDAARRESSADVCVWKNPVALLRLILLLLCVYCVGGGARDSYTVNRASNGATGKTTTTARTRRGARQAREKYEWDERRRRTRDENGRHVRRSLKRKRAGRDRVGSDACLNASFLPSRERK